MPAPPTKFTWSTFFYWRSTHPDSHGPKKVYPVGWNLSCPEPVTLAPREYTTIDTYIEIRLPNAGFFFIANNTDINASLGYNGSSYVVRHSNHSSSFKFKIYNPTCAIKTFPAHHAFIHIVLVSDNCVHPRLRGVPSYREEVSHYIY